MQQFLFSDQQMREHLTDQVSHPHQLKDQFCYALKSDEVWAQAECS